MKVQPLYWRIIGGVLRLFFSLLYGPLAWTYDWVSGIVSLGMWGAWISAALPYLDGPAVLELGHGPGHLLVLLKAKNIRAIGLDSSPWMSSMAYGLQSRNGYKPEVINGYAQSIPFLPASFDQVVATFPAEYFWEARTLHEIRRVLKPGGALVALPAAWITGMSLPQRAARWLFRITGQAPPQYAGDFLAELTSRLETAGFQVDIHYENLAASVVLLLQAHPTTPYKI